MSVVLTMFRFLAMTALALGALSFGIGAAPAAAAPNLGPEPGTVMPISSVTVTDANVRLGDLFSGHPIGEERIVMHAPAPGQRIVVSAEQLASFARNYGLEWRPSDAMDRSVVYRAGQTVTPKDILAAIKADLALKGLPEHYGLRPSGVLPTLTVPMDAGAPVTIRETVYDAATKNFSAIVEVAGPQYIQLRGMAMPTVTIPVLKADAGRTDVITEEMIEDRDIAEAEMRGDFITDATLLVGKSPRGIVRAGRPIRNGEVARVTLVEVPVLRADLRRDTVIHDSHLTWMTVNAADLPQDAVTDAAYLIGKAPRSFVAANAPIRRADVTAIHQVTMAVANRDLQRGEALGKNDINWVAVTDNDVAYGAIIDPALVHGRITTRPIRAGQALRAIDLTRQTVINRGKLVTIVYATNTMKLTVQGEAMEDGGLSEAIRVANAKSKTTVIAEVLDANTVRVVSQQSAMQ
jgi:flagella basal body P-ring formation protein FlgA